MVATTAQAQQQPAAGLAAAAVRQATPAEVKARLDAEEAAIEAEPAADGLDKRLSHYIRANLPAWAPLSRAAATNPAAADAGPAQPSPFICHGDFDGNGLQDTAAMMKERNTGELRLMAFHQITVTANPGNLAHLDYQAHELATLPPGAQPDSLEIACHGPGTFTSIEGDVELRLKNDSIEFSFVEYYFSDSAYRSLIVGD